MNYKLCTISDNMKRKNIDLSSLFENKKTAYKLDKLDEFTMMFKDENELKVYLISKGLLQVEDVNKLIFITYGDKNVRDIPLLYKANKKEVDNIKTFADEINYYFGLCKSNAYSTFSYGQIVGDYRGITDRFKCFEVMASSYKFLEALQNYCSPNPKQSLNIDDIQIYINENHIYTKSKLLYVALFELFRREFYKYDEENKKLNFDYKGFRDFCVFYCEYKDSLKNKTMEKNR